MSSRREYPEYAFTSFEEEMQLLHSDN